MIKAVFSLFSLTSVVLVISLALGGGTRAGYFGDVVAQLVAIPLLLLALWGHLRQSQQTGSRLGWEWVFVFGLILVFFIQLVPLPPALWSILSAAPVGLGAAGETPISPAWRTLSLTPHATWAAAASLIPPLAIFSAVTQLDRASRLRLNDVIVVFGALSCVIGLMQVAQGPVSWLRLFQFTNSSEAVGFFANRNHFAALLYVTLVLATVWLVPGVKASVQPGALNTTAIFWLLAVVAVFVAVTAGLAMARSRTGVFLAIAALVGVALIVLADQGGSRVDGNAQAAPSRRITVAIVGFAGLFAALFGLQRTLSRFDTDPFEDLRFPLFNTTLEAALESLPFGTGFGSFVRIYAINEKSQDILTNYANRAHNDFAEVLLEAGVLGALLMLAFAIWYARASLLAWFGPRSDNMPDDTTLRRAATVAVALLLAHSLVDYPLRTTALSVVFAFCAATLVPPRLQQAGAAAIVRDDISAGPEPAGRLHEIAAAKAQTRAEVKHNSAAQTQSASPRPAPNPDNAPQRARKRWGEDIDWPEAWIKPDRGDKNSR